MIRRSQSTDAGAIRRTNIPRPLKRGWEGLRRLMNLSAGGAAQTSGRENTRVSAIHSTIHHEAYDRSRANAGEPINEPVANYTRRRTGRPRLPSIFTRFALQNASTARYSSAQHTFNAPHTESDPVCGNLLIKSSGSMNTRLDSKYYATATIPLSHEAPISSNQIVTRSLRDQIPILDGEVVVSQEEKPIVGPYSVIHKGIYRDKLVAVKAVRWVKSRTATERKFDRESVLCFIVKHRNIQPLLGCLSGSPDLDAYQCLVTPWCKNGDAEAYLVKNPTNSRRLDLICGVWEGVRYLHEHQPPIPHGDLKPSNVLIGDDFSPKITDFGLSNVIQEKRSGLTSTTAHTGTLRYLAYELVSRKERLPTLAADIWAMGCITMRFLLDIAPYDYLDSESETLDDDIRQEIKAGNSPMPTTHYETHKALLNLLNDTWKLNPCSRPLAIEGCTRIEALRDDWTSACT